MTEMPTFKLTVAYDGTDFVGWQRQAAGASIQGLLEGALFPLEERAITVIGAGRTDAGVHALGQVAACSLDRPINPATLVRALNARLPPAVRVIDAVEAVTTFQPRFDAVAKTYRYCICTAAVVSPFEHRYVWHLPGALDVGAMDEAARVLVGEHDFACFRTAGAEVESNVRVLFESTVARETNAPLLPGATSFVWPGSEYVAYTATGTGFLRHMVRAVVGSLVEIGKGRRPVEWMRDVMERRDRANAGPTAPPQGLCLMRVSYAA